MKSLLILILGGVFFFGCSKASRTGDEVSYSGPLRVRVTRGEQNQASFKVEGHTNDPLEADSALFEQEGFTAASDRFLQMDVMRRSSSARLAELLGEGAKALDLDMIALGVPIAVANSTTQLRNKYPEVYELLESYAEGVNRYLANLPRDVKAKFAALTRTENYQPLPWQPSDSVAIGTAMSFFLSSTFKEKFALGMIQEILFLTGQPKTFLNFLDLRPIEDTFILGQTFVPKPTSNPSAKRKTGFRADAMENTLKAMMSVDLSCKPQPFPFPDCSRHASFGSNNWVVSSKFTNSDATLLANDPHLPLTFPMTFYEVSIDSKSAGGTIRARGVKPPGVPGVLIGHNDDIAWGLTNLPADVDDIYLDQMNQAHDSIKLNRKLKALTVIAVPLDVRDENGVVQHQTIPLKYSDEHGPMFSDWFPPLQKLIPQVEAQGVLGQYIGMSYKWTGHKGSTELAAVIGVNRSRNFNEFKTALQAFQVGAQNFIYGDKQGNVGYYAHGNFPVRKYVETDQLPPYTYVTQEIHSREWEPEYRQVVPEAYKSDGFIVTANNDPFGQSAYPALSNYQDYFGFGFTDGIRASRITTMLNDLKASRARIDAEDMRVMQNDHRDELAIRMIGLLENSGIRDGLSDAAKSLYDQLISWKQDGAPASEDRKEPVVFYQWAQTNLLPEFFKYKDNGGGLLAFKPATKNEIISFWPDLVQSLYATSEGVKTLYHKIDDGLNSTDAATKDETSNLLRRTLEMTVGTLQTRNLTNSFWGQVNTLLFNNSLAGIIPDFGMPLPRVGAMETVNPSGPGIGPSFRLIMTLRPNQPIQALISMPGGNYENDGDKGPFLQELYRWLKGQQRPMIDFM